jgi:phage terminase large subunit
MTGDAKHVMLVGGSRSGKTFVALRALIIRATLAPKSRHVVLRFRFNHVKSSVILDTFPKVMALCFPQLTYTLDKTDWYATLPNGSQIWFGGLDDKDRTEKILGQEYATIFFNECSQIPLSARNMAVTRLAQNCMAVVGGQQRQMRLKAFYDCNPPSWRTGRTRCSLRRLNRSQARHCLIWSTSR